MAHRRLSITAPRVGKRVARCADAMGAFTQMSKVVVGVAVLAGVAFMSVPDLLTGVSSGAPNTACRTVRTEDAIAPSLQSGQSSIWQMNSSHRRFCAAPRTCHCRGNW